MQDNRIKWLNIQELTVLKYRFKEYLLRALEYRKLCLNTGSEYSVAVVTVVVTVHIALWDVRPIALGLYTGGCQAQHCAYILGPMLGTGS